MSDIDSGTQRLDELSHEFVERLRRGKNPTVEQFAAEHPELAAEIQDLFPALLLMEQIDPLANSGNSHRRTPADDMPVPQQLGEYRVLRCIGHGGMGTVYEAVQESLGRHVAVKMLSPRDAKNATLLERFKREAQAAAQLHHTNIVPVFGVGEAAGTAYYAMQLIHGQPLDRVLTDAVLGERELTATTLGAADADYYRAVARIGQQATEALAYAHANGVLHRDIKPANMLLDAQGTVWITDFGLARIEGLSELTVADEVIGTLRYVPPERFEGRTDARGDIYSLGLALYELLTRQSAFGDVTRAELVHRILHVPPPTPRSIDRRIPRDLETIILKAIAREPDRRYPSAAAMAEDLQRFRADRPILARRLSVAERSWRWCRKNPVLALVSSLALMMLLVVAVVSTFAYFRESNLRDTLQIALERAKSAETQGRNELFASHVASAKAARLTLRQGQRFDSLAALRKAAQLLPDLELQPAERQRRREELRDLAISCLALPDIRDLGDVPKNVSPDVFHPDRCVQRDATGTLIVSQWPGGSELARLTDVNEHTDFTFTPERDTMMLIDRQDHALHRWQLSNAKPTLIAQLREHDGVLRSVEFSRDTRRVLLIHKTSSQGLIEVLEWPSGKHCFSRELPLHGWITPARLSPDGRFVAMIEGNYGTEGARLVRVNEVDTGVELARLQHVGSAGSMAWHTDSQTLAVGIVDSNDVVLWNVAQQKKIGILTDQRGGGPWLCMNSTGELLCSLSSWGNNLEFWHPYLRKPVLKMPSEVHFAWSIDDGRLLGESRLASGGWHYLLAEPSPVLQTLARNPIHGSVQAWRDISVHRDGRLLAVGSNNGVTLFDLETGHDVGHLPVGYAIHPWFIPTTGDLLTYSTQGLLHWPVSITKSDAWHATFGPPKKLPCIAASGTQVASDDTGRVIAAAGGSMATILHDFGQRVITLDSLTDCRTIAVSPNGQWVVTGNHESGPLDIWDGDTGKRLHRLSENQVERSVHFSPDGRLLSFGSFSPHLIRTGTWDEQPLPDASVIGICGFSPDGRLVIDISPPGVTLRDSRTGRKIGRLDLPDSTNIWHAKFTPDGRRVIINSHIQNATFVWDLRQLSRELLELGLGWDAPSLETTDSSPTVSGREIPIQVRVISTATVTE